MENGLHLIYLYADSATEWNCSQWRCLTPSDAINAEHEKGTTPMTAQLFFMPTALGWDHPEVQRKLGAGDVLIFQRNVIIPEVWHAIDYWRALGKTIVIDLDDAYPDLMPSNPAFPYWSLNKPGIVPDLVKGLEEGLRRAHALTSPSRIILRDWEHAVRGFHLPNWTRRIWYEGLERKPVGGMDYLFSYDDTGMLFAEPREGSEGQVILGWGGSISHVDSWLYSGIVEALDRIFKKHPHPRLKVCGHAGATVSCGGGAPSQRTGRRWSAHSTSAWRRSIRVRCRRGARALRWSAMTTGVRGSRRGDTRRGGGAGGGGEAGA